MHALLCGKFLSARNENNHFRKLTHNNKDRIMVLGGHKKATNKVKGDGLPWTCIDGKWLVESSFTVGRL